MIRQKFTPRQSFYLGLISVVIFSFVLYKFLEYEALQYIPSDGGITLSIDWYASQIQNDHVGNEWSTNVEINGDNARMKSNILKVNMSDALNLVASAEESDSIPDYGENKLSVPVSTLNLSKSNNKSISVIVEENRGRYTGNIAEWEFNFIVKRKINMYDVVNYIFSK